MCSFLWVVANKVRLGQVKNEIMQPLHFFNELVAMWLFFRGWKMLQKIFKGWKTETPSKINCTAIIVYDFKSGLVLSSGCWFYNIQFLVSIRFNLIEKGFEYFPYCCYGLYCICAHRFDIFQEAYLNATSRVLIIFLTLVDNFEKLH